MRYYIQIPFRSAKESNLDFEGISDDLFQYRGFTFMRISWRAFERITKTFRSRGWSYQVVGAADVDGEVLATLLLVPNADLPGLIYWRDAQAN